MKRLSDPEKLERVRAIDDLVSDGRTVPEAAKETYGISEATYYNWVNQLIEKGLYERVERPTGRKQNTRQTERLEIVEAVDDAIEQGTSISDACREQGITPEGYNQLVQVLTEEGLYNTDSDDDADLDHEDSEPETVVDDMVERTDVLIHQGNSETSGPDLEQTFRRQRLNAEVDQIYYRNTPLLNLLANSEEPIARLMSQAMEDVFNDVYSVIEETAP